MTDKELLAREELLEDILDALEDGDYEEAEELADEAIMLFSKEAFGYYYMGEALFLQLELDAAVPYYEQAVERASNNPNYKARLALMYAKLGEENKARQIYQSVLLLNPNNVDALIALGVYAINGEDYASALIYLNQAVNATEENSNAHKIRALIHTGLGNYKEAIDDLDIALEIEPKDNDLWLQKINLLKLVGQYKTLKTVYEAWIDLAPEETSRYATYGAFLKERKDYQAAEAAFAKAIELEIYGDYAALESYLERAWVRLYQNNTVGAIEDFRKIIDLDAKLCDAYLGIADARVREGNPQAALTYLDLGLDLVIDDQWLLYNKKGLLLVEEQEWEQAMEVFQAMLEMDNEEIAAESYFSIGKMHQAQGDLAAAFKAWRKASALFHIEAEEYIEEYCQVYIGMELKEREDELLKEMEDDFSENEASPILQWAFGQYWIVDIKTTIAKNKMLAQLPAAIKPQITKMFANLCFIIVPRGVLLLNADVDSDDVRMLYSIKNEDATAVSISGIPLNGKAEQVFVLRPTNQHLVLRGFGGDDADVNLYLKSIPKQALLPLIKAALERMGASGDLDFMGEAFVQNL